MYSSGSRKEGVHHLLNESWPRLEGVVSPLFSRTVNFSSHRLSRTGEVSSSIQSHVACVLVVEKIKIGVDFSSAPDLP